MSNMKKTNAFFEKVSAAGLDAAFGKMSTMASETIGVYLEDIIDDSVAEMERPVCRIRYCEKDQDGDECFIFEIRQSDEKEYGFSKSFRLIDDRISYQALTEIRQLIRLGYRICFA